MSATRWTLTALGVLGGALGVLGVVAPDRSLDAAGFEPVADRAPGDHTLTILRSSSLAALSEGGLSVLGATLGWRLFPARAVAHRLLLAADMVGQAATGRGPRSLLRGAAWEGVGAAAIGAAVWFDRRR